MKKSILSLFLVPLVAIGALAATNSQAQVLLEENFTFTGLLTANGWTATSGAGSNSITSAAPGLTYPNLPSSGVGNAASLTTSGEDVRKTYAATTTDIYTSCLINVSAAQSAGDYFYSLSSGISGFVGRLFAKSSGTGFQLGIQKGSTAPPSYVLTDLTFGTTYLVVIKITKNAGTTSDDIASLWINPVLGASETTPGATMSTGTDQASIDSVLLRQGAVASAPTVRVGDILVGTTWASVTPSTSATAPIIDSFSPVSGEVGSTVIITGVRFGVAPAVRFNGIAASSTVNPAGTEITATVPSGATTGPISVEVAGQPVATSSSNFTVVDPLAPTLSTSGTLTAFNTIVGTPSTSQSFTVSAANLSGNVIVTAPAGFEVSADDSTFGPSATLAPVGGVLTSIPVYVRIAGSAAVGPVSGNVSVAATGATTQNVAASGSVSPLPAFVNLSSTNTNSYTQNFDSLGTTTISNVVSLTIGVQTSLGGSVTNTLNGWYAAKIAGTGGITNIVADNGSGTSGAVYNYGSATAPANADRSLGGLATGSFTSGFGALIKNETGQTLQGVQISFISKLWRSSTVSNSLTFGYGVVDGSAFTTANFLTAAGALPLVTADVVYPAAATGGAVDGNLPANQIAFNNVTIPQQIAPGETLFIRWQDVDGSGSDAGMAIDNVSLTALTQPPPATAPFVAPTSAPANEITRTQAGVTSSVTGDGGSAITTRGFVYAVASVNPTPTIGGTGTTDLPNETAEVGPMTQTITGLTAGTTYAVRSYASNAVGTTYSPAITFTTLPPPLSFTGSYSESFSTYTGTLPAGWTATSSSNSLAYGGAWGTGSTGGFRGVGATTGNVIGYQHTGSTGLLTVSVTFTNGTGATFDTLSVSYLGRTAVPANTRTPAWAVSVNGSPVEALAYSTANTDGEAGAPADLVKSTQLTGLSIAPGAEFTVTWVSDRGTGSNASRQIGIADFSISTGAPVAPTINVTGSAFSAFSTTAGTPSAAQTISVSGSSLTGNITITPPAGYQVSSDGITFSSSVSLTPVSGSVAATTISVRLSGASSGSFSGDVSFASTGATTQTRAVSGTVTSAYDAWAAGYSLTGASALPTADPDNDGLNNNNEYAFGTNPTLSNASLMSATTSAGNMTVTWIERNSGFTYAVQSTVNLATTAFANDGSVTPTTSGNQAGVPSGYTRKQFTVAASNNKFFRVRATP
jgi:hypothetical protein